jgi:hypothetical protein
VKRSAAFLRAERKRRRHLPVSKTQKGYLKRLAEDVGVEVPQVHSLEEATRAIERLEEIRRQPVLAGFSASTGGSDAA